MKMNKIFFKAIISLFLFSITFSSFAQCTFTSTTGYSVEVVIVPKRVVPSTTSCPWGYNYNVEYDYAITFSGASAPANMWTLQAQFTCGSDNLFVPLQTTETTGSTKTTTANPYRNQSDCNSATPSSIGCTTATVTIQGPGMSTTTSACPLATVLPVDLISFEGERTNGDIMLTWQTASELNNDFFTVEKLLDDQWYEVGVIPGNGTTQQTTEYTFKDENTPNIDTKYRLKQTDYDGSYSYSDVISINADTYENLILWPNPATETVAINLDHIEFYSISDAAGIDFTSKTTWSTLQSTSVLDIRELPSGLYFIQIENENFRFIKQ